MGVCARVFRRCDARNRLLYVVEKQPSYRITGIRVHRRPSWAIREMAQWKHTQNTRQRARRGLSHLLSRGYASSVAGRLDSTKPSQAVRHTTHARSVSNRYLARRSRARVMLEPRASSQISKFCNNRQNRTIFENVDIRAEDTDVFDELPAAREPSSV